MDFKNVKTDTKLSEAGVWIEHDDETSFLVARSGNKKFNALFNKMIAPYRQQFERGKLNNDKQVEIMCKCMSETILLGWEGLTMDGKELVYSKDQAYELLSMEGADEFRDLIMAYSMDAENFRQEEIEEQAKN